MAPARSARSAAMVVSAGRCSAASSSARRLTGADGVALALQGGQVGLDAGRRRAVGRTPPPPAAGPAPPARARSPREYPGVFLHPARRCLEASFSARARLAGSGLRGLGPPARRDPPRRARSPPRPGRRPRAFCGLRPSTARREGATGGLRHPATPAGRRSGPPEPSFAALRARPDIVRRFAHVATSRHDRGAGSQGVAAGRRARRFRDRGPLWPLAPFRGRRRRRGGRPRDVRLRPLRRVSPRAPPARFQESWSPPLAQLSSREKPSSSDAARASRRAPSLCRRSRVCRARLSASSAPAGDRGGADRLLGRLQRHRRRRPRGLGLCGAGLSVGDLGLQLGEAASAAPAEPGLAGAPPPER